MLISNFMIVVEMHVLSMECSLYRVKTNSVYIWLATSIHLHNRDFLNISVYIYLTADLNGMNDVYKYTSLLMCAGGSTS